LTQVDYHENLDETALRLITLQNHTWLYGTSGFSTDAWNESQHAKYI